jgi:hypothetical protein
MDAGNSMLHTPSDETFDVIKSQSLYRIENCAERREYLSVYIYKAKVPCDPFSRMFAMRRRQQQQQPVDNIVDTL